MNITKGLNFIFCYFQFLIPAAHNVLILSTGLEKAELKCVTVQIASHTNYITLWSQADEIIRWDHAAIIRVDLISHRHVSIWKNSFSINAEITAHLHHLRFVFVSLDPITHAAPQSHRSGKWTNAKLRVNCCQEVFSQQDCLNCSFFFCFSLHCRMIKNSLSLNSHLLVLNDFMCGLCGELQDLLFAPLVLLVCWV